MCCRLGLEKKVVAELKGKLYERKKLCGRVAFQSRWLPGTTQFTFHLFDYTTRRQGASGYARPAMCLDNNLSLAP